MNQILQKLFDERDVAKACFESAEKRISDYLVPIITAAKGFDKKFFCTDVFVDGDRVHIQCAWRYNDHDQVSLPKSIFTSLDPIIAAKAYKQRCDDATRVLELKRAHAEIERLQKLVENKS
jgi:hypothetical protein